MRRTIKIQQQRKMPTINTQLNYALKKNAEHKNEIGLKKKSRFSVLK